MRAVVRARCLLRRQNRSQRDKFHQPGGAWAGPATGGAAAAFPGEALKKTFLIYFQKRVCGFPTVVYIGCILRHPGGPGGGRQPDGGAGGSLTYLGMGSGVRGPGGGARCVGCRKHSAARLVAPLRQGIHPAQSATNWMLAGRMPAVPVLRGWVGFGRNR